MAIRILSTVYNIYSNLSRIFLKKISKNQNQTQFPEHLLLKYFFNNRLGMKVIA